MIQTESELVPIACRLCRRSGGRKSTDSRQLLYSFCWTSASSCPSCTLSLTWPVHTQVMRKCSRQVDWHHRRDRGGCSNVRPNTQRICPFVVGGQEEAIWQKYTSQVSRIQMSHHRGVGRKIPTDYVFSKPCTASIRSMSHHQSDHGRRFVCLLY